MERKRIHKKKKRRLKKWVKKTLLIIILLSIVLIPTTYSISNHKKIIEERMTVPSSNVIEIISKQTTYENPIDDLRDSYKNKDIKAKLVIKDIGMDTVITQATNNVFYLKYNAYRQRSDFGNPFLDYRNLADLGNERQVNIYSHNFYDKRYKDSLPFSKLEAYLDEKTFNTSKEILLYTDKELLKYEVYAVKIVTKEENEHMIMDARTNELWKEHLDKLLTNSKYCTEDCSLEGSSQLLVLQTCNYEPSGSFILVIARKVI